jgi:hypothetical protein
MPKVNVNTASRADLLDAGLRAELADEILKIRRRGKIIDPEALDEVPGVGPATLEQLRKVLDFSDQPTSRDDEDDRRAQRDERHIQEPAALTAELGQALADLVREQTQHNVETLAALTSTVDWARVVQIQGEFLRRSLERMAGLTQRQLELAHTMMAAAVPRAQEQDRKAA